LILPKPLVTVAWLAEHLHDADLVIVDCRFDLSQPDAGRHAYAEGHLPGAVYFDLDEDLSAPAAAHGGRHPLPEPQVLAQKLGAAGIKPGAQVVVYDNGGQYAARCWWLLRWLGHDDVTLLDGGFQVWQAAGHPVTDAPSQPEACTFVPHPRSDMTALMTEVRTRPDDVVVVDARAAERFAGQASSLDTKAGHIPGAVNRPWQESLNPDGTWRTPVELAARFKALPDPGQQIHSCGSGVTACANLLAMEIAGLGGARLYPGSWTDWCSYDDNPVAK
jgi:thiosulfate/3-mercaptopyruvate sulfurtransferase